MADEGAEPLSLLSRLVGLLKTADLDLTGREIADALWLAGRTTARISRSAPPDPAVPSAVSEDDQIGQEPDTIRETVPTSGPAPPPPDTSALPLPCHVKSTTAVQATVPPALPGPLPRGAALRSLRRREPAWRKLELDEDATVRRLCDEQILEPVFRPIRDRWLDLELVLDVGPTLDVWRPTLHDLARFFLSCGVFSRVRVWELDTGRDPPVLTRYRPRGARPGPPLRGAARRRRPATGAAGERLPGPGVAVRGGRPAARGVVVERACRPDPDAARAPVVADNPALRHAGRSPPARTTHPEPPAPGGPEEPVPDTAGRPAGAGDGPHRNPGPRSPERHLGSGGGPRGPRPRLPDSSGPDPGGPDRAVGPGRGRRRIPPDRDGSGTKAHGAAGRGPGDQSADHPPAGRRDDAGRVQPRPPGRSLVERVTRTAGDAGDRHRPGRGVLPDRPGGAAAAAGDPAADRRAGRAGPGHHVPGRGLGRGAGPAVRTAQGHPGESGRVARDVRFRRRPDRPVGRRPGRAHRRRHRYSGPATDLHPNHVTQRPPIPVRTVLDPVAYRGNSPYRGEMFARDRRPDFLVLAGNTASSGDPAEFRKAREWLDSELLPLLGLDRRRVIVVSGPHDLDWSGERSSSHKGVGTSEHGVFDFDRLQRLADDEFFRSVLIQAFSPFWEFARTYGPADDLFSRGVATSLNGLTVGFARLNLMADYKLEADFARRHFEAAFQPIRPSDLRLAVCHYAFGAAARHAPPELGEAMRRERAGLLLTGWDTNETYPQLATRSEPAGRAWIGTHGDDTWASVSAPPVTGAKQPQRPYAVIDYDLSRDRVTLNAPFYSGSTSGERPPVVGLWRPAVDPDTLERLPQNAAITLATRCVRRIRPLFADTTFDPNLVVADAYEYLDHWVAPPTDGLDVLRELYKLSDAIKNVADTDLSSSEPSFQPQTETRGLGGRTYLAEPRFVDALIQAVSVVHPEEDDYQKELREAVEATISACPERYRPAVAAAINRDLDDLLAAFSARRLTRDSEIRPEFFGPIWPYGRPDGFPEMPEEPEPDLTAADVLNPPAMEIDPDYFARAGYDPAFLGTGDRSVPLPKLTAAMAKDAAANEDSSPGPPTNELRYHHFSAVLNRTRRLAYYTAVNMDGRLLRRLRRGKTEWFLDPRVEEAAQVEDAIFRRSRFDRGHLVSPSDSAWGRTNRARAAYNDAFHLSNVTPQHAQFNQGMKLWLGLESYLRDWARDQRQRMTVFSGPVFRADDPVFREVAIPLHFWKVAVLPGPSGLTAAGFLVGQEDLVRAEIGEMSADGTDRAYQVSVREIESLTGLDFGRLRELDVFRDTVISRPAGTDRRVLESFTDAVLERPTPA